MYKKSILLRFYLRVSQDLFFRQIIGLTHTRIITVSFYCMYFSILQGFYDAHMIHDAILLAISNPVEKNQISGTQFIGSLSPHSCMLQPSPITDRKLWQCTRFDITTLIGAPTDKTAAPFHTLCKSIPTPVFFTSLVPDLLLRHLY